MVNFAKLSTSDRLAGLAGLAAAVASILGFIPGLYRDPRPLVVQSQGQDLATLILGVPVLAIGLWFASKGSLRGRLVAMGALGYLLYTYVVFAFFAVLSPATVLYIAVVGLASWSFFGSVPALSDAAVGAEVGGHLPRRPTGVFLLVVAVIFALLWLSQIGQVAVTGILPKALRDAGWPNNPIYVLDLGFVLPVCTLTGIRLMLNREGGVRFVVPLLIFIPLLSAGVLSITAFAVLDGQPFAVVEAAIFVVTTVVAAALAWLTLNPRTPTHDLKKAAA